LLAEAVNAHSPDTRHAHLPRPRLWCDRGRRAVRRVFL